MLLILMRVWCLLVVVALLGGGTRSHGALFEVAREGSVEAVGAVLRVARAWAPATITVGRCCT